VIGALLCLNSLGNFPISEADFKGLGAAAGRAVVEVPPGPRRRRHGAAAYPEKGFRSKSRMTLLDGNVWLSLASPRALSGAGKASEAGYPPYNIELLPEGERGPEGLRVTLAVAGFSADELEVSIEEGELIIRGRQHEEQTREYLHRGIAARQFKRSFQLASGVEVRKAELDNGLLAIELVRPRKEKRVLKVGITAAD
jgi:HSP20 family molecular chaperone IbpA